MFFFVGDHWLTGSRNELVHTLFTDEHCTLAMKKATHNLYDVVPYYYTCVQNSRDNRAQLTVCHNKDDAALPPIFEPPVLL